MQPLVPLYTAESSITLVDGLLEGDHCMSDCLAKGNFGLGTLDYLDGEVMVYDGVAYHQGAQGVRVFKGDERTPFVTVTLFDKQRSKQVVFEYTQEEGMLVGFWCLVFVGSSLNVPGFHFHFLSTDKQRGGHVLRMEVAAGATAYLQIRIQHAQVDLPYSEAWMDRDLMLKQAPAELAAAEK